MLDKIILHARKPTGFLGRLMVKGMNKNHGKLTDWGLEFISKKNFKKILDIGCGGGQTIKKLADINPNSIVYGIDYSEESINVSSSVNKENIKKGRVILKEASVSEMPFNDNFFDLIIAVESYFFWPDLENDMKKVLRILKPNGTFLIISGEYKNKKYDKRNKFFVKILNMHYHSKEDLYNILNKAGFSNIEINENNKMGWLCAIAGK